MPKRTPSKGTEDGVSRASFTLVYDGPALQGGTMDVRDLAPSLLAVGKLVELAARRVNGDNARAQVSVSADVKRGSFQVVLEAAHFWEQVRALVLGEDVKAAKEILELLFGGGSVWGIYKLLKGRKPDHLEKRPDTSVALTIDKSVTIINSKVWALYEDPAIRAESRAALRPLEREGIEAVEVTAPDQTEMRVEKSDLPAFGDLPEPEVEQAMEGEQETTLVVVKPSFESDWRWTVSDGRTTFGAYLKDEKFQKQIDRHQVVFGKGDRLRVRLHWKARESGGDLQLTYAILEVLEFVPLPPQRPLPMDGPDKA